MNKTSKILVTVGAIVVFFLLFAVVMVGRDGAGQSTPGFLGLILVAALIGALRAIWKKRDNDDSALQK